MNSALGGALRDILEHEAVYDALPTISKIMTIDSRLKVSDAINALHRYRRSSLCVYQSESSVFVAVFDTSSVIQHYLALQELYSSADKAKVTEPAHWDVTLNDWFQHELSFPHINMEGNLLEALRILLKHDLPRLFVWDPIRATVFSFITKATIFSRIIEKSTIQSADWELWAVKDCQLGVGPDELILLDGDMTIVDALKLLKARNWSACPVVDSAAHTKYVGLLTIQSFHRLLNRALMEGFEWTPESTVESILHMMSKEDSTYSPASVCKYVDGPVISNNVFIDRLSTETSSGPVARDVPTTVPMRDTKDPNRDLVNYLSTTPAVMASDLTLKQVFAHVALTEDKRIVLLDPAYKVQRLITATHIARYILGIS